MAHHGVLFLDELPEFHRDVLEVMRQPLEDGQVSIARAAQTLTFPARFQLVAAMNPCPCGYLLGGSESTAGRTHSLPCTCTAPQIRRYLARISGPLLDRIDIHIEVPRLSAEELQSKRMGEGSASVRQRVVKARERQAKRLKCFGKGKEGEKNGIAGSEKNVEGRALTNAAMSGRELKEFCAMDASTKDLLKTAINQFGLSGRGYDRILKVSRTIADLEESEGIEMQHVAEAINYRAFDRKLFG